MTFGSRSGDGSPVHFADNRLNLVEWVQLRTGGAGNRRALWQSIRGWPQGAIKWPQDGQVLNLFLDLGDYFFGQGGACQLRNSSGVLGKPTPPLWTQGMSQGQASLTPEAMHQASSIIIL